MDDLLCFDGLVETEVIVPLLESVEGDVSVEFAQRVRL